ncbi:MAG: CHASE2 domain-containing protein [Cyanobacteria bacterium P01_F01_bin.150]
MISTEAQFRLKVQQVEQTCLFELSWENGQQLTAQVGVPSGLMQHYRIWQQTYLNFYQSPSLSINAPTPQRLNSPTPQLPNAPTPQLPNSTRGRTIATGQVSPPPPDWHAQLAQAEATLLYEFQQWLRQRALFDIRAAIAQSQSPPLSHSPTSPLPHSPTKIQNPKSKIPTTLFLTCTPLELARLPWESWELGTEFGRAERVAIVRSPANIPMDSGPNRPKHRARILAIMGDDTGLDFQGDREAVQSCGKVADITFVGWQPGQSTSELKKHICQTIADPEGWDVLFFAGHSNETQITGGELAIAPGASVSVQEISPYLTIARQKGLQAAIFNSCSGLNIAESLVALGLSQVVVMREPIHNRVAQAFLVRLVRSLSQHQPIHQALIAACQFLKTDMQFTHPSAHLIPSLFCHPGAHFFQILPRGWRQQLRQSLPSRTEAIALAACTLLSVLATVQSTLLDWRLWSQTLYQDWTGQMDRTLNSTGSTGSPGSLDSLGSTNTSNAPGDSPPPVTLVQIDEKSIRLSGMEQPNPIDRAYLAKLLDALVQRGANIIGIDYLLDRQQPDRDPILAQSVRQAVDQNTWLVFAGQYYPQGEVGIGEATNIADLNWSLQGYIESATNSMMLPDGSEDCRRTCPFGYLLALIRQKNAIAFEQPNLNVSDDPEVQPNLTRSEDLRSHFISQVEQLSTDYPDLAALERSRFHPINSWAYSVLGQSWLPPVVDYSIPPDLVYDAIPAWTLLDIENGDQTEGYNPIQPGQIVIIASGGYGEAGVGLNSDNFDLPPALAHWRKRSADQASPQHPWLTGAEVHAYTIHHLLNQHIILAIPDLWILGVAVLGGVFIRIWGVRSLSLNNGMVWLVTVTATGLYGWACLQLYAAGVVLVPFVMPSVMFWIYLQPIFIKSALNKQRKFSHA